METVAEGVESKEQLDFLVERNCLVYQGNYFSSWSVLAKEPSNT